MGETPREPDRFEAKGDEVNRRCTHIVGATIGACPDCVAAALRAAESEALELAAQIAHRSQDDCFCKERPDDVPCAACMEAARIEGAIRGTADRALKPDPAAAPERRASAGSCRCPATWEDEDVTYRCSFTRNHPGPHNDNGMAEWVGETHRADAPAAETGKGWIDKAWGKWPGNETDTEALAALDEVRGKDGPAPMSATPPDSGEREVCDCLKLADTYVRQFSTSSGHRPDEYERAEKLSARINSVLGRKSEHRAKVTDHQFRQYPGRDECCSHGPGRPMCGRPAKDHEMIDCAATDSGTHSDPICPACGVALGTAIPLPLAQRILAALEAIGWGVVLERGGAIALADELRKALS